MRIQKLQKIIYRVDADCTEEKQSAKSKPIMQHQNSMNFIETAKEEEEDDHDRSAAVQLIGGSNQKKSDSVNAVSGEKVSNQNSAIILPKLVSGTLAN